MADASTNVPPRLPGRPRMLDAAALRTVEQVAREHPVDTLPELRDRIAKVIDLTISTQTLRKRLRELGFVRLVPSRRSAASSNAGSPAPRDEAAADVEKSAGESPPARYGYRSEHRGKAQEAAYPHGLSDAEWALVEDIFADAVRGVPRKYSRRTMVDAMTYVVRGGVPWRMLPKDFPPWLLVFKTFRRWSKQGRFERMYDRLRVMWRVREGRAADPTAAVIDSQSVKTSAQGGPKGYDAGKKVKGRKRHLLTDVMGLLLVVCVQIGSTQDRNGAHEVVAAGLAKAPSIRTVFTDSGYAGECRERLEAAHPGLKVEIARHPQNRTVGIRVQNPDQHEFDFVAQIARTFVPLPKRWVIERTNAWNDRPRRLAKDQERTLESSAAWIWFAEGRLLLRRLALPRDA